MNASSLHSAARRAGLNMVELAFCVALLSVLALSAAMTWHGLQEDARAARVKKDLIDLRERIRALNPRLRAIEWPCPGTRSLSGCTLVPSKVTEEGNSMPRMKVDGKDILDANVFETVIENFPDVIQSVDKEGKIVFVNKAVRTVLGYSTEEYLAMNVKDLYVQQPDLAMGFEALKEAGQIAVTTLVKNKGGEEVLAELRSFAIYDDGGEFLMSFTILREVKPTRETGA